MNIVEFTDKIKLMYDIKALLWFQNCDRLFEISWILTSKTEPNTKKYCGISTSKGVHSLTSYQCSENVGPQNKG